MRTGWGISGADAAADLETRHQPEEVVMDVRRALLSARELGYPIVLQLHWYMVAVSRGAVNHDRRCRRKQRGVEKRKKG